LIKLLKKTREPAKLLEIAVFDYVRVEMHDFVSKLTNLIQLFTEGFTAGDEPEPSPVYLLLENLECPHRVVQFEC
jgi:hypothetical protein